MKECKDFHQGQLLCDRRKTLVMLTDGYVNYGTQTYSGTVVIDKLGEYGGRGEHKDHINFDVCYLYDEEITFKNRNI